LLSPSLRGTNYHRPKTKTRYLDGILIHICETPQSEAICNIQRDAANNGGTVLVEFIDFTL